MILNEAHTTLIEGNITSNEQNRPILEKREKYIFNWNKQIN